MHFETSPESFRNLVLVLDFFPPVRYCAVMPAQLSFDDVRRRSGRGGPRHGAGRPPGPRPRVQHRARPDLPGACPAHVTLRLRRGLPSLRSRRLVREFQESLRKSCERGEFRVLQYSLQRDHAHMIVEADSKEALGRGMKSVAARLARVVNRIFERSGAVLDGRYHLRLLRTPREVRSALAYVLLNVRKHWFERFGSPPPVRIDEASSGRWFTGWCRQLPRPLEREIPEVASARTWLARKGWRRHGPIDPASTPGQ